MSSVKEQIIQIINGQAGGWRAQRDLNERMFGETSEASVDARARIDMCVMLVNMINSNVADPPSEPEWPKDK